MLEAIYKRYSCRNFKSQEVEKEKIDEIIKAGLYAPSGKNGQSSIVITIRDKKIRDKYVKINAEILGRDMDTFYNAPVILVILAKKGPFEVYDGSATLENMLLEATDQGLATCWIFRAKEAFLLDETKELFKSLDINLDEYEGISNIALGYPSEEKDDFEKKIKDNRFYYL